MPNVNAELYLTISAYKMLARCGVLYAMRAQFCNSLEEESRRGPSSSGLPTTYSAAVASDVAFSTHLYEQCVARATDGLLTSEQFVAVAQGAVMNVFCI